MESINMAIPKVIHQFWTSETIEYIPEDIQINIKSWSDTHPDFMLITWSIHSLTSLLKDFHGMNLLESINACRFPAMQSDIIRLAVLYEYGGFWSDLKNFALQPFINNLLVHNKLILTEHWPTDTHSPFTPHLVNSFIGAPEKNVYILKWLHNAHKNIKRRVKKGVVGLTGTGIIMKIMQEEQLNSFEHHLIKSTEIWNVLIKRKGGSYNNNEQHWSARQKLESPFLTDPK